jgi:hypothetical protein
MFEIFSALVVVLLQGPSICMSFLQWILIQTTLSSKQLPQYNNKQKSNQTTKPRKTTKKKTEHEKNNYTERRPKEKQLSPLGGCPIPGPIE